MLDWADLANIPAGFADNIDNVNDADSNPTNELNTSLSLVGTSLEIVDAGGTISADLSSLVGTDNQNLDSVLGFGNSAGSQRIVNLANPINSQDAATRAYVDSAVTGATVAPDSLDFDDFKDAMVLDATTTVNMNANNADLNFDNSTLFIDSSQNEIGIGTSAPLAMLHVSRGGAVLASVVPNVPPAGTPISGPGARMMWVPIREAFRAGRVIGTEWDAANIGLRSIAMGEATTASGQAATALGSQNTASGDGSTALGAFTTASGDFATGIGLDATATGEQSIALGRQSLASGTRSIAIGRLVTASGTQSMALGVRASTKRHVWCFRLRGRLD